jgi:ankyrin repeat protein
LEQRGTVIVDVLRVLVLSGAHPNRADRKGRTPLEAARANHHEAAALALVQAGAIERYSSSRSAVSARCMSTCMALGRRSVSSSL